jgi:hypothetical protein
MTVVVFTGPTIQPEAAKKILPEADYLPPARQGDVYRVAEKHHPQAIGIIDGYFQQIPSVWHKEILWAMAKGIHVFGAASMGALRAAELHAFGMHGIGTIFELYRDGKLTDDDEVAVTHGPAEIGYIALSEAMVNVRVTLRAAADAGVIADCTRYCISVMCKELFYQNRTYKNIFAAADKANLPTDEIAALRQWIKKNKTDLKREDAVLLLHAMHLFMTCDRGHMQVDWILEDTQHRHMWA